MNILAVLNIRSAVTEVVEKCKQYVKMLKKPCI